MLFEKISNRQLLFLTIIAVLIGWLPFLLHINDIGAGDWSFFYSRYEALRKTVLQYHQFPFWNPWRSGGTPLAAHPEISFFSLETLNVLIFGSVSGLHLSVVLYVILGVTGMYYLLQDYTDSKIILFWGAVLYGLHGATSLHISTGHFVIVQMSWFPWTVFLAKRLTKSSISAAALGVATGLSINSSIHYLTIMNLLLLLFFLTAEAVKNCRNFKFYQNFLLMSLTCLSLSAYKLVICYDYIQYFPREISLKVSIPAWLFIKGLIYPGQSSGSFPPGILPGYWGWNEMGSYIGLIAVLMFILSLFREFKWWHAGVIITVPLIVNSTSRWLPGFWLREIFIFKSMFAITRWRFMTIFFIIIGACRGADFLLIKYKRKSIYPVFAAVAVSTAGLLYNQYYQWGHTGWTTLKQAADTIPAGLKSSTIITSEAKNYNYYTAVTNNIGLKYAYENMLGYRKDYISNRIPVEDKINYFGETVPLDKQNLTTYWTPDKIVLETDKKGRVLINQNPGNYWYLNNKQLFPENRSFEMSKLFILDLPDKGTFFLEAKSPKEELALITEITATAALVILLLIMYYLKQKEKHKPV